jgi:hypothetical protein
MKKVGTTIKKPSVLKLSPELRELQGLMPMSGEDLLNLRTDIQNAGEVRDAIKVYQKGPDYLILCGAHRWEIADGLGLATVPVEIWEGSPKERRELVVGDNLNRRHLTAKQKAAIAEALFKNNPARSAREVAQKVNLDHKTAGKIKKALVGRGEIPHDEKVTDTRGRKQPATKPKKFKVPGPLDQGAFTLTDEGYKPEPAGRIREGVVKIPIPEYTPGVVIHRAGKKITYIKKLPDGTVIESEEKPVDVITPADIAATLLETIKLTVADLDDDARRSVYSMIAADLPQTFK